ncbi:type IV pilus secretin PilQ [Legionella dresdenensis]|uniref:Type IV pilus secretin PilQ n=1 Tax=Legionella dresdenensis TaxID=450200 RepID=A0ABV8CEP6_9GAMM
MRKFIVAILLLTAFSTGLYAKDNVLVGLKTIPLPDDRIRIDFIFSAPITDLPASFMTEKPSRLILDFINANNELEPSLRARKIQLGSVVDYAIVGTDNRIRAMFNLAHTVSYSGAVAGNIYALTFSGSSGEIYKPKKEIFVTKRPVNARYTITGVDFRGTGKQSGRVVIDVNSTSMQIDVSKTGQLIKVTFNNTCVLPRLLKRYDVADFQSPVKLLSLKQIGKDTRLTITSKGDYGYYAYQVNKQFYIDIYPLTAEEAQKAKLKKQVFTGKRLSLNFQKIPIRSVLQLLADFTGINMVVSDQVQGDITLRLNDTPWDQALDIILKTNGLDKRQTGNVMLIAPAATLLKREKDELKAQQEVTSLAPLRSELLQINYAKAIDIATLLKDKNTSLLSKRGALSVDTRTNTIWIQDTGKQIEDIRELVQKLDIPVKQVLIEARIVNVTKQTVQDLGIRFGVTRPTHLSGTLEGANTLVAPTPPAQVPLTERLNLDLGAPVANPATIGVALAKLGDNILLDMELSALESEDKAEIIASPRLMTTNQQSALIESGEEIPYQQSTSSGATAVAFKKAVLSLKVTPQITPDNRLLLDLQINQDAPSTRIVNGVPAIDTKEIQTNVLVDNGQTVVLGGIYKRDSRNNVKRVPFLGVLPVVGVLFRNTHKDIKNEELLIFITPRIITNNLAITTVEGQGKVIVRGAELDKFGKPVVYK